VRKKEKPNIKRGGPRKCLFCGYKYVGIYL